MSRKTKLDKIPTYLKHKPIYVINRYAKIDGFYKNDTDVIGLSLGKAQWSGDNFVPSVKVWRDVKVEDKNCYKISRQSEETTLTRALDMAMLVVCIYDICVNNDRKYINDNIIETIFGNLKIETFGDNSLIDELKNFFKGENSIDIKSHIEILKEVINNTNLKGEGNNYE